MTRYVQEETRPRLCRAEERGQPLKTLSTVAEQLNPGTAVAILGTPGTDIRKITSDILKFFHDETLVVWFPLSELPESLVRGDEEAISAGGEWDRALDTLLGSGLRQAAEVNEGLGQDELASLEPDGAAEEPGVERLIRFGDLQHQAGRWPILVFEDIHRLPWPVSERFQRTLRKALDNEGNHPTLRMVFSSFSDFLSGEAIAEGGEDNTSPLYGRTTRYVVLPLGLEQLWESSPLPMGLPDRLIELVYMITSGSIGMLEVFVHAIHEDPHLGEDLVAAIPEDSTAPDWFWSWLGRAEGLAASARATIRLGLGAMLACPKGRSWPIVQALEALLAGNTVDEASADAMLPLELAGFIKIERLNRVYRCSFISLLLPVLLNAVLPEGRSLRDRLEAFVGEFSWIDTGEEQRPANSSSQDKAAPKEKESPPSIPVKVTGSGAQVHVHVPRLEEPSRPAPGQRDETDVKQGEKEGAKQDEEAGARQEGLAGAEQGAEGSTSTKEAPDTTAASLKGPMKLPPEVARLMAEPGPQSAKSLLNLIRAIALATEEARQKRNPSVLTFAQLEINWLPLTETLLGESMGQETSSVPDEGGAPQLGTWAVRLLPEPEESHLLEAPALFLPPERMRDWMQARSSGELFTSTVPDDSYALGVLSGLLLGQEQNPRLMVESLDKRLAGMTNIAISPLLRVVQSCLDPYPRRRPTIEAFVSGIEATLQDKFGPGRRLLRYLTILMMVVVVFLGLWDWARDAEAVNPSWFYASLKVVGAAAWAALYVLGWFIFGRSDKEQLHQQLWAFINQRMNRIRWMAFTILLAGTFSLVFAYRLYMTVTIPLSMDKKDNLEEVKWREAGSEDCGSLHTLHRFAEPVNSAVIRLRLDLEYIFVLLEKDSDGRSMGRKLVLWTADGVASYKDKDGDTLYLEDLPTLENSPCIPTQPDPTPTTEEEG